MGDLNGGDRDRAKALISVSGSPCDRRLLLSGAEDTTWFRVSNVYLHRTEEEKVQECSLPVKSVNRPVSLLSYPVNGGCASPCLPRVHTAVPSSSIHQLCTPVQPVLSLGRPCSQGPHSLKVIDRLCDIIKHEGLQ